MTETTETTEIGPVGFIGVGHLATHLVEGLAQGARAPAILLSPRGADVAARLAERFGAEIAGDNQAVADACALVILATPPGAAVAAARAIRWRAGRVVVSVCAGVPLAPLADAVRPARALRAMPITAAARGESPTPIFPRDPTAEALFARLGPVRPLDDEDAFDAAATIASYYGWMFALIDETIRWTEDAGVPAATARLLVAETTRAAAGMVAQRQGESAASLAETIAPPGSFTGHGLDILRERGALDAFRAALEAVRARLREGGG